MRTQLQVNIEQLSAISADTAPPDGNVSDLAQRIRALLALLETRASLLEDIRAIMEERNGAYTNLVRDHEELIRRLNETLESRRQENLFRKRFGFERFLDPEAARKEFVTPLLRIQRLADPEFWKQELAPLSSLRPLFIGRSGLFFLIGIVLFYRLRKSLLHRTRLLPEGEPRTLQLLVVSTAFPICLLALMETLLGRVAPPREFPFLHVFLQLCWVTTILGIVLSAIRRIRSLPEYAPTRSFPACANWHAF